MKRTGKKTLIGGALIIGSFSALYFALPPLTTTTYEVTGGKENPIVAGTSTTSQIKKEPEIVVTHLKTPEPLRAIYMTACVAGTPSWREKLAKLIDETELNAVVIDIKDYTGTIAYRPEHPALQNIQGTGCRAGDMKAFLANLHARGIYTIARVTVFQDPYYTKAHPELAVKRKSDGGVWKDRKGLSFIDVSAKPFWDYIVTLSHDAYAQGFDEINFDYIRFPSDGDMKDIAFPWTGTTTKAVALERFFEFLEREVKPSGAVISADLFGMTTTNTDDLNIGQLLEPALRHFDYVSPMVYPSHYPPQFNGWANPNQHVYDVVKFSMSRAVVRAHAASTTPLKLRPWLQDFDYGGNYDVAEVRAQIQATYDSGLTSWMLWDPRNIYTKEALNQE